MDRNTHENCLTQLSLVFISEIANLCNIQDFSHSDNAENIEKGEQGEKRVTIRSRSRSRRGRNWEEHWTSTLHSTATKKTT